MQREPGVIILGCKHGGLAAARTFGQRGIPTLVLVDKEEFGLASKYVTNWEICPHPRDEEAFIEHLLGLKEEWGGALLLDTKDYYLEALSRNKARLTEHFRVVSPDWEMAQTFLEKDRTYALADECGVPHPKVLAPQTMDELEEQITQIQFPVMLKPVNSAQFQAAFNEKLLIADTVEDLRTQFKRTLDAEQAMILSEIIPGTDYKTLERVHLYINSRGDAAVLFSNLKLRQTPPMYGVMRVGKSTTPNAEVNELSLKLLRAVDYRGFASVEFKRDYRDNTLKLMEANIRMPRSSPLPIKSGVDFPYMIYRDLVHDDPIIIEQYHPDTYLIDLVADWGNAILREPQTLLNLPRFLQPYLASSKTFAVWSFDDPQPFINQIRKRSIKAQRTKR